ncbi:MAG: ABC transporter permease subunit [Hyphomicrobiales bacterium]|nr:ABC transporter permease subunit [Hyphomicrobiales bacterium]
MAFAGAGETVNHPGPRGLLYQAFLVLVVLALVAGAGYNAYANMRARGIPLGFGFWDQTAGFDVNLHLIPYSPLSTYGRAFWVGLINTLLVAAFAIPLATFFGFAIGLARLSPNWLMSRSAVAYTNAVRNTPLLLQLLFWYNVVLKSLPAPRESIRLGDAIYLNNRGLFLPALVPTAEVAWFAATIGFALVAGSVFAAWARRRQASTGAQMPTLAVNALLVVGLPVIVAAATGAPFTFDYPALAGFNLKGGVTIIPELAALTFGLVIFTSAFIAEIVRAGVLSVPRPQTEAAMALGLHRSLVTRLVIIPQALRLIVPPLTSQYLNVVKNSSLAVFIGYPDLVQIFAGTVLNQTQAAMQVMSVTMAVYLSISLAVAAVLNAYNASLAPKER